MIKDKKHIYNNRVDTENKNMIIVIDPGHGGHLSGATYKKENEHYSSEIEEEDINLIISSMVYTQLINFGYTVYMTRFLDKHIRLSERVKLANELKADAFISIHCNAHEKATIKGIEIYRFYGSHQGKKLSNEIYDMFKKHFPNHQHRLRESNFYVLRKTKMPSILIECE